MQKENKKIILLLFVITFLFAGGLIFSQQKLEVEYPTIPGTENIQDNASLQSYLKYIYNLSIFLAGTLSLVLVTWGGIRFITSTNRPGKMADARAQITSAFLGIIIIFTSYLFLNTLNPELLDLKIILPKLPSVSAPLPLENIEWPNSKLEELPVGTLITSEYTASSFYFEPDTDPDCGCEEYSESFPDVLIYPTSFQGSLSGRRLKRIHEVAEATTPVADYLVLVLFQEFVDKTAEMMVDVNQFYKYMIECTNCAGCNSYKCKEDNCDCSHVSCSGDPCLHRKEINKLVISIPMYYDEDKNPTPPLRCKMAELEYLSKAFEPFLDDSSYLVKNEDYQDNSFWYDDEAKKLRKKIKSCIAAGEITKEQYHKIEELIDLMADVENKGTYTPATDPPERDVETNINHLEALLGAMRDIKRQTNPFDQEKGYLNLMSFAEEVSWEIDQNIKPEINSYYVDFPNKTEEVDVKEDPATFYAEKPFIPPSSQLQESGTLLKNNIVWAQSEESVPITPALCKHLVEIPIGKSFDQTIKLTIDIIKELKNIHEQGHIIIDKTWEVIEPEGLADQMYDKIDEFIELPEEIPMCKDGCGAKLNNLERSCECEPNRSMSKIKAKIENIHSQIKTIEEKIKDIFKSLKKAKGILFESYFKLNSVYPDLYPYKGKMVPHPKAGERDPIGEDPCCTDQLGNCRTDNWLVDNDKIEKIDYTLEEKLAEIQKLLNMSRETVSPQRETKSVYALLIEDLIDLEYAEKKEILILGENKMDLQNCIIFYEEIEASEGEEPYKSLLNCYSARSLYAIDSSDTEVCSPDPYLDCDFFKFTKTRTKSTMSCYCYNKKAKDYSFYSKDRFPELYDKDFFLGFGNNYFCCVVEYE